MYDQDPPHPSRQKLKGVAGNIKPRRARASQPKTTVDRVTYQTPVILWRTGEEQRGEGEEGEAGSKSGHVRMEPVSLLADWRDRFKGERGFSMRRCDLDDAPHNADEERPVGEGFDLDDLQSVARILSQDNLTQLQEMLRGQGMGPAAIQAVLEDLLEGREPDFETQAEEGASVVEEAASTTPGEDGARRQDAGASQRGGPSSLGDMPQRSLKRRQSPDAHDSEIGLRESSSSKRMRRQERATMDSANRMDSRSEGCAPRVATSVVTPPTHHRPVDSVAPAKRPAPNSTAGSDEAPARKRRGRIRNDDDGQRPFTSGTLKKTTGEKFKTSELDGTLQDSGKAAGTPKLASPRASGGKHTKGNNSSTDRPTTQRRGTRRSTRTKK